MSRKLEELENEVLDLFVRVNSDFGNDAVLSKLVSIIFLSPTEISLEELVEKTNYSPATICNKTRTLLKHGLIKRVSKPGTKKAFFYMEKDAKKMVCGMLKKIVEVKVNPIKENLPRIVEEFRKNIKSSDSTWKKKLEIMENHVKNVNLLEKELMITIAKIQSE